MAKVFLIVTIKRGNKMIGEAGMVYPDIYNAQEVESAKAGPLIYEGGVGRGEGTEEMLVYIEEDVADAYKAADPSLFRIVSEDGADTWLDLNQQFQERFVDERVTDADRLTAIIAKSAAGIALSAEDLKALDPDDSVPGITRGLKKTKDIFNLSSEP